MNKNPKISIILPCLNEEAALGTCLREIQEVIDSAHLDAEIIVIDNGSTDDSLKIARQAAAVSNLRAFSEPRRGYGAAYLRGLSEAQGDYFFMADADHSYDFKDIPRFVARLKNGSDLVVGNRFTGGIEDGAMPLHHRYFGNPFLSFLAKRLFKIRIGDIYCGIRAISRAGYQKITLYTVGMEFAPEMIIKAAKQRLRIEEIPVPYGVRMGKSKLQSIGDGWRGLRFILLYSPLYLFLLPGALLAAVGLASLAVLYFTSPTVFGIQLFVHPMFLSVMFIIVGWQLVVFSAFSKIYAITHLDEKDAFFERLFRVITLERAALAGILVALLGGVVYAAIFAFWIRSGFGSLDQIKNSVVALAAVVVGIQTFFSAFMLSMLGIQEK